MTPWHEDGQVTLWLGDAREVLRAIPAESVDCVVTSPPYWSLRDYGIPPLAWGERPGTYRCPVQAQHEWGETQQSEGEAWGEIPQGTICTRCGAWRGCLGLEPEPGAYIRHMMEVFAEVFRVLKGTGTLWLNIGDSYASSRSGPIGAHSTLGEQKAWNKPGRESVAAVRPTNKSHTREAFPELGIRNKELIGIPWMLAFALREQGWRLRSDIIWHKPAPMPESVTDRPTKSHEHVFLFAKRDRYYYDAEAIREPVQFPGENTSEDHARAYSRRRATVPVVRQGPLVAGTPEPVAKVYRNRRDVWTVATRPGSQGVCRVCDALWLTAAPREHCGEQVVGHFATYPPALVRPAILAGCPEGGIVLDPFVGTGTTMAEALSLGRRGVGIDASEYFLRLARARAAQRSLLLAAEVAS